MEIWKESRNVIGLKQQLKKIERLLGETINDQGIDYLQRKPYEVYKKIISLGNDGKLARLVLVTLLSDASIKAREMDMEDLSKNIQEECYMKKKAADEMSAMYKTLFNAENMSESLEHQRLTMVSMSEDHRGVGFAHSKNHTYSANER